MGIVGVGLFSYLLLGGAYQSLAIEVGFINATTPMWVLLIGVLTGQGSTEDAIRPQAIGGLALAFFGTVLIITKGHVEAITGLQLNLGNLWSLLAAMAFAWFSLRVREWSRTIAPLPLTVVTGWAGVLFVMLPVYLVWIMSGGAWFSTDSASSAYALITIGYIGLAPTMLGNLFYLFGVATNGPAQAAAFLYLSPLFSAALARNLARRRDRLVSFRRCRGDLVGTVPRQPNGEEAHTVKPQPGEARSRSTRSCVIVELVEANSGLASEIEQRQEEEA